MTKKQGKYSAKNDSGRTNGRHSEFLFSFEVRARDGKKLAGSKGESLDQGLVKLKGMLVEKFDVGEELLNSLVQHRSAPYDRLVLVDKKAHRHDLQVVAAPGRDDFVIECGRFGLNAKHVRNGEAVHIGIEHTYFFAESRQGAGEIGRHG